MTMTELTAPKTRRARPKTALEAGLPDPRPVTDYAVALTNVGGAWRMTVTLAQPCVVRLPVWPLIDCTTGNKVYPASTTVVSNTTFYMTFPGFLLESVAFIEVPYQDVQVQNFSGGFVAPGARWFRAPVMPF